MKAVSFGVSVPSFLVAKSIGRISESALFGGLSRVRYGDVEEAPLPGDRWVRLSVIAAGICGSDTAALTFKTSPILEPFSSFPAILGHEVVAQIIELGPKVSGFEVGQRVAVDPMISCTMRGYPGAEQCSSCAEGLHCTCGRMGEEGKLRVADKPLARGMTIGFHASLPGAWSERMLAHESQLFAIDDQLSDRSAVLIEPLSIAMHAALGSRPFRQGPALVIGSGPIALSTIWALRAAGYTGELVAQVKRKHEAKIARSLGATETISPGPEARSSLMKTGAKGYKPIIGDEVYAGGGFPLIFDCVGSPQSLAQCLRYASPRAQVVLLGCAAEISKLDLSLLWARELTVKGYLGYGAEQWRGVEQHTFQITHDMLVETGAPVEELVTHTFALSQYREALATAVNRGETASIKVVLEPNS